jgi:hypothetical protein
MRRFSVATVVVLALAAASLAAAGGGKVVASASGGSHLTLHDVFGLSTLQVKTFTFDATLTSDGSADGRWHYQDVEDGVTWDVDGPVTCATIVGNHAWVGGTIEHSSDPSYTGLDMWFQVLDNGEGSNAPPDITTLIGVGGAGEAQAYCDAARPARFPWPVEHGNIQVRD